MLVRASAACRPWRLDAMRSTECDAVACAVRRIYPGREKDSAPAYYPLLVFAPRASSNPRAPRRDTSSSHERLPRRADGPSLRRVRWQSARHTRAFTLHSARRRDLRRAPGTRTRPLVRRRSRRPVRDEAESETLVPRDPCPLASLCSRARAGRGHDRDPRLPGARDLGDGSELPAPPSRGRDPTG
jgi:hypothetical protein